MMMKLVNRIYTGSNGRQSLIDLELPENFNGNLVVFVHGFMGFKDWGAWHLVQEFFTKKTDNKNRGVKQAGFLVLRQITMPRVLIEMGFVSNKEEGEFLNSEEGQDKLAEAIAGAILDYKNEFFNPSNNDNIKEDIKVVEQKAETIVKETPKTVKTPEKGVIFKVQISASTKELSTSPSNFKGLSPISVEQVGSLYKYYYASEKNYDSAKQKLEEAKQKGYKTAFLVAYKDGIKISITDAIK